MLTCEEVRGAHLIERYVAGTLPADESAELEEHYLVCARCQEGLRFAAAVRDVGREPVTEAPSRWPRPAAGAAVLFAAGIAGILLVTSMSDSDVLAPLGRVDRPPIYLGVEVRGDASPADSLFDLAMADYDAGRYRAAAAGLRAALASGADPVPSQFFLGASLLQLGEEGPAAEALGLAASLEGPYAAEARYYRAKALLRRGEGAEALAELDAAASLEGPVRLEAAALADSVRRALGGD